MSELEFHSIPDALDLCVGELWPEEAAIDNFLACNIFKFDIPKLIGSRERQLYEGRDN